MHVAMMSLDPLNTLNPSNPCPVAGIADCELHALFRRPENAVPKDLHRPLLGFRTDSHTQKRPNTEPQGVPEFLD